MKISIIIPALNEEKMLPCLLDSIRGQDFDDYEVIVADAKSKDRTREIAENAGCQVVDGGLPAVGRNAGARVAAGDFLFFLDADVILPPGFIRNVYNEMEDRFIDLATCEIRPLSDYQLDRIIHKLINLAVILNLWIDPKAFGFCIFVTKRLFNRVGGFDETIYVAEDSDFVKRASVYRQLRFLTSAYIMVSIRRFEKEGRFAYMKKGIKLNLYRTFRGEIRNDEVVKYEFGDFDKPDTDGHDTDFLDRIEKRLLKVEERSRHFTRGNVSQKQIQPQLDEYSHLIKELDIYLNRKERKILLREKMKNFFRKHRGNSGKPGTSSS
ncbi:MAG: glycosyltransferase [Spirochaetaceae bacterium]|jgi:glycosyltransferase involved in cell wall biosynthesis|nr:glycosyltransferase [Spirochaetaceae bacterium]